MKALELIQLLQKLPPNADVYMRGPGAQTPKLRIIELELRLPPTVALNKPGVGWADSITEAITGELVGANLAAGIEEAPKDERQ